MKNNLTELFLLPKHRDTVKLNFPLHILFVKKKMEEKNSWDNNT